MTDSTTTLSARPNAVADVDVCVVGAGFAGLYATHALRNQVGLEVQGFDFAPGPGGTWHWNRYPGARCDIESAYYCYTFDDELRRDWKWSERFAAQPEILAYLEHVADRYDLRRSYRFNTRVQSVIWDESHSWWTITTSDGAQVKARFVVSAGGNLSVAKDNEFPGASDFNGQLLRTSNWPTDGVDLRGKRVAVIGTGSTGIQVTPLIADEAESLTVFQRTANFACPLGNRPRTDEDHQRYVQDFPKLKTTIDHSFLGAPYPPPSPSALAEAPQDRRAIYDRYYHGGGFRMLISTYADLLFDPDANETAAQYIRDQITARVTDPKTAELLTPRDHPYGTKRAPFETNYFEIFNRDNVTLVDARSNPITAITSDGIRTTDRDYSFDVIVMATGFDAFTGALSSMGIVGRNDRSLNEYWANGPRTFLGLTVSGFPNLFVITGPQSSVALSSATTAIEHHVNFVRDTVADLVGRGVRTIEPSAEAEEKYNALTDGIAQLTLLPRSQSSWYMGANIPGKPRVPLFFAGGNPLYQAIFREVAAHDYGGFALDGKPRDVTDMLDLTPVDALGAAAQIGAPPAALAYDDGTTGQGAPAFTGTPIEG